MEKFETPRQTLECKEWAGEMAPWVNSLTSLSNVLEPTQRWHKTAGWSRSGHVGFQDMTVEVLGTWSWKGHCLLRNNGIFCGSLEDNDNERNVAGRSMPTPPLSGV